MDRMHSELQSMSSNYKKHGPALRAALKLGLNLLDKYNSLMDHSEVYWIAIGTSFLISSRLVLHVFI